LPTQLHEPAAAASAITFQLSMHLMPRAQRSLRET
jgi:hypothetical protein